MSRARAFAATKPKDLVVPQIDSPYGITFFVTPEGQLQIDNYGPFTEETVRKKIIPWLRRAFGVMD